MKTCAALAALAMALAPGCLFLPRCSVPAEGQRRGLPRSGVFEGFGVGVADRADVLCALGQPDWASQDGACLAYWTREEQWSWFIYLGVDMGGGIEGVDRYLLFRFDEQGKLAAKGKQRRGFTAGLGDPGPGFDEKRYERYFERGKLGAPGAK